MAKWYKYTVKLRGSDVSDYVDLDEEGWADMEDFLDDLARKRYAHVEFFRADYKKVRKPTVDWLKAKIRSLETRRKYLAARIRGLKTLIS